METVITVKEQNGKISIKIQTSQPNDENIYDVILRHLTTALASGKRKMAPGVPGWK